MFRMVELEMKKIPRFLCSQVIRKRVDFQLFANRISFLNLICLQKKEGGGGGKREKETFLFVCLEFLKFFFFSPHNFFTNVMSLLSSSPFSSVTVYRNDYYKKTGFRYVISF